MDFTLKSFYTPLIVFVILIVLTTVNCNESSPNEHNSSRARSRIIKQYSGPRPEHIVCVDEDFQPDPHNCATFYRCVKSGSDKYIQFRFQCGPGTIYDPEKKACNYPQYTRRSECGGYSPPLIHVGYDNEISSNEYNEVPIPMDTNNSIYTSTSSKSTTITTKETPSFSTHSTTKRYITSTAVSRNPWTSVMNPYYTDDNVMTVKPIDSMSNIADPISQDGICTSDGFMGDSKNCRKFYRCVANQRGGYTRYEFSCTETTIWDDVNQICNHAWAVKRSSCTIYSDKITNLNTPINDEKIQTPEGNNWNSHVKENNVQENNVQQQLQIGYGTKVTQTQSQIANGFVKQNQTQINYGDRLNHNKHIGSKQNQTQISHGSATSQSQTQIDYGNNVIQTQLQIDHSNEASQNQIQLTELSTQKTSVPVHHYDDQEINKPDKTKCTEDDFIGDDSDCRKFYRCVNDGQGGFKKIGFNCAAGTGWDSSLKTCNHIWAIEGCNLREANEFSPQTITTTYKTTLSYDTAKSTQSSYTTIQDNEGNENSDVGYSKLDYGPTVSSTTVSSTTTTTVHHLNHTECTTNGFMGDDNDCKIFYRCVDNGNGGFTKYVFNCGDGTLWDPDIEACNHAKDVKKCGSTSLSHINKVDAIIENSTTSVPIYVQSTMSTHSENESPEEHEYNDNNVPSYGSPNNNEQASTSSKLPPVMNQNEYICTSSGFIGDMYNCKKFYRCVDDGNGSYTKYEFLCGEGTLWDEEIKSCNHAWAVTKCGNNDGFSSLNNEINSEHTSNENPYPEISTTTTFSAPNQPIATESTTEPLKPQSDSEICVTSGFFGYKTNCKKFYRCVTNGKGGFNRYDYTCKEGTVWDQSIETCYHAWAVKKCGTVETDTASKPSESTIENFTILSTTSRFESSSKSSSMICTSEGFYGDQNDCKKFYRCVNNGKGGYTVYNFNCGDGTIWDQEIQACNHDSYQKCSSVTSEFSQTAESQSEDGDIPQTTEIYATPSSTFVSQCESEGFFADPNDCRNFIRCVSNDHNGFTKYEFTCSKGTVWVQEMLACDHDTGEVNCNSQIVTPPVTNEEHQQTTERYGPSTLEHSPSDRLTEKNSSGDAKPPSTTSSICLSEGYYPNENDCRKFYRCVDNGKGSYTKYDYICSEGTAWDSNIQSCNHINQVASCQGTVLPDDDNKQTTENMDMVSQGSTSSTTNTPTSSTTQKPLKPVNNTEHETNSNSYETDRCYSEGFFGNVQDCTKFYRCVNDGNGGYTKYDFKCGEGTIWDKDVLTCNHPQNVVHLSCNQSQSNSNTEQSSSNNSTTSTTESNVSESESVKKPEKHSISCTKPGFFANPNDCKKFYRCVSWDENETKFSIYHFDCGEGTIWDPAVETCNHENSVYPPRNCSNSQTSSTPESTTKTTTETTTSEVTTIQQTEENTTELTTKATEQSGESTTEQLGESTTEHLETSTTEEPREETTTNVTTEPSTESTTEQSGESTTEQYEQSTTEQSSESTTDQNAVSTTTQPSESTTEQQGQSTTEQPSESTTEQYGESTTTQTSESTTEDYGESTTEQPSESTTEPYGESTTEQPSESTTEEYGESTTEQPSESTTEQYGQSTTEQPSATTTGPATEGEPTETDSTTEKPIDKNCPETEEDQYLFACPSSFRRHPKYCNLFYQCDENEDTHDLKIAVFTCPNNTIYDESQVKCVKESKAEKSCNGEISQKRRVKRKDNIANNVNDPIVVSENSYRCTTGGYFAFEKEGNCSPGFLKCTRTKTQKLRGLVYQCPDGYLFWNVSRRCEPMYKVRDCTHSSINDWNKRWEIPIERKNVAW